MSKRHAGGQQNSRALLGLITALLLSGCSSRWYLGEWLVTDVAFAAVSAISAEDAQAWLGADAVYAESLVVFRGDGCQQPQFQVETVSASVFYQTYRATFAALGINGETTTLLHVHCGTDAAFPASTFIHASDDSGYVPWDGAFFRLERHPQ